MNFFASLLIVLLGSQATPVDKRPTPAKKVAAPPAEIAGQWDVERVLVDREEGLRWEVRPDEPSLVGRSVMIESGHVNLQSSKMLDCQPVDWRQRATTWSVLVGKGFPRPEGRGFSSRPNPNDFGLKVSKARKVIAYSLCSEAASFPLEQWAAFQSPQSLAIRLDSQVLLLLRRRPKDAKPTPSFDCAKAASPAEKAICGNYDLASWDRSVALAFRQALERNADDKEPLKRAQKDWLHERDKCEDKVPCIDEAQWRRVDELSQQ